MATVREGVAAVDLLGEYLSIREEIDAAVERVLSSGWYILGREVAAFEEEFAAYLHERGGDPVTCVGVASGTDALQLALMACGIEPGDEVITVSHTAVATAAAITLAGGTPVFVDIDPVTYTMDPGAMEAAITLRTKAVIPVHLYGHPAEMETTLRVANKHGLRVIEDCAQAHGARYRGRAAGTMGDLGCFSFYPTKNLGAMGDGGAVVSRDPELAQRVRLLREYGWTPAARYVSQVAGMNSRLDELQAAILRVKLRHLDEWTAARRGVADLYAGAFADDALKPVESPGCEHVYHLYVVRVANRDAVRERLAAADVGTGIHYPVPIHLQPAYENLPGAPYSLPHTEAAANEILSLPMYPSLDRSQVETVAAALHEAVTIASESSPAD
jgi:dTDP-3-amino-3,4,6-trideoxy-alpha-D-glucose transaminase